MRFHGSTGFGNSCTPPDSHAGLATSTFCAPNSTRTSWISTGLMPGGQQGFQRPAVQVADHRALKQHADPGGDGERHRQRRQRVERQPLRRKLLKQPLHR